MAAETSPFSFHCMICFEEFGPGPEDRYPVVLPCGHTYVCNVCSERLDKCMECRTPLYMNVAAPNGGATTPSQSASRSGWSSASRVRAAHTYDSYTQQPAPTVKKRLPLPKNVVLLSLIEATALASSDGWDKVAAESPRDVRDTENEHVQDIRSMGSMIDAEEDEEEKIKKGATLAAGVAGTYAVAVKEGLDIFPHRPKSHLDASITLADEDIDNLLRLDGRTNGDYFSTDSNNPARLSHGDRVQIVSVEDGWAKLARGYGYVRAGRHQLVKVGNSIDRACKLEAILRSLSKRKKELRLEQSELDNQFIQMLNRLQASLQTDEDLTVIVADTFSAADDDKSNSEVAHFNAGNDKPREPPPQYDEIDRMKAAYKVERQTTPPSQTSRSFGCFAGTVFGSAESLEAVTGNVFLPELPSTSILDFIPHRNDSVLEAILPAASHPSASAMRAGAQAWRDRHSRAARNGSINFRTGMSGHMGLLGNHARHPHEYLNLRQQQQQPVASGTGRFRMSSHTGLTTARAKSPGILGSFTPALLRPVGSRQDDSRDQVHQAGSF